MIDASSVGMLNCIVKYKNRLIFYYEVEKKTKKNTRVDFFLTSASFCWSWWLDWCATVSSLEDWPVTDGWLFPVWVVWFIGVTLTGSTTDSPLEGAALWHGRVQAVITPPILPHYSTRNHHCSLQSLLTDLLNPLRLCAQSYIQLWSNLWYFIQLLNNIHTYKCSHL